MEKCSPKTARYAVVASINLASTQSFALYHTLLVTRLSDYDFANCLEKFAVSHHCKVQDSIIHSSD
ncbi:hypothetical protein FORC54_0090 [Vibrio vulnificus]|nr:hypothetical protein FORC54_0090 [Vibrio vulnificus]